MAKPRTTGQNLTRLEESLDGVEIEKLNELSPGLGAKIHKLISNLGNIQAAQAGHSGTVVLAKQKAKDTKGETLDAMKLQGGTIGEASPATKDDQYVTLGQVRSMLTCENLADILEDCIEDHLEEPRIKPACAPTALTNPREIDTELNPLYDVAVLNEWVYVLGNDFSLGTFHKVNVYRIRPNNSFVFVGSVGLSDKWRKMVLHGPYIFLTDTISGGGSSFGVIHIGKPDDPEVVFAGFLGTNRKDIAAQGRWIFLPGLSDINIVDISNPLAPVIRGVAT